MSHAARDVLGKVVQKLTKNAQVNTLLDLYKSEHAPLAKRLVSVSALSHRIATVVAIYDCSRNVDLLVRLLAAFLWPVPSTQGSSVLCDVFCPSRRILVGQPLLALQSKRKHFLYF